MSNYLISILHYNRKHHVHLSDPDSLMSGINALECVAALILQLF